MEREYLQENDPHGEIIYQELLKNNKDYFQNNKKNDNLEFLFDSSNYSLSNNSMIVKLNILKKIRKYKLNIYNYFDVIESYFNQHYYNMKLNPEQEKKLINTYNI